MQTVQSLTGKKRMVFVALLVVVIAFIARTMLLREPDTEGKYTVQREDLVDTVQASGVYSIGMQKQVVSTATGVITNIYVTDGQVVNTGDPLFHVESTATDQERAEALSAYLAAQTAYEGSKATEKSLQADMFAKWDAFKELAEDDEYENDDGTPKYDERAVPEFHIPEKQWQAAEATYKNQQTVVSQKAAALDKAYLDYQATQDITINAPASGTVTNLLKREGDQVLSLRGVGQNIKEAETVLVIANLSNPHVMLSVNEAYLPRISKDMPVEVVFDPLPDTLFHGTIDAIETVGAPESGITTYQARVSLHDIDGTVLPGMTAIASIETSRIENTLSVPNSALLSIDGAYYVVGANGSNKDKRIPVELGTRGIAKTEIVSGVEEGMVIMANPPLE